ncbi:phenylalanine--tRNA ligase subunit alpha [Sulfidibacter corallicola]|uniref:Phenylalanine--tRNA ligase alpha subunit n=1 Tax=Sulfidibacter corallicola TaxID=2818388 RepID=A0A8A4TD24_SULCO|nr:phenylalanine--tRNA ligase subunit alpha [Sulfidibacter corallicola]QTD47836.1 phenylalanine--tRNA ligase subunit alpha [Sulfidibacter corallicola]
MDLSTWNLEQSLESFRARTAEAGSADEWEALRIEYLGKKNGMMTRLLTALREAPRELKPRLGKDLNVFKKEVERIIKERKPSDRAGKAPKLDLSLPGVAPDLGGLHPVTLTMQAMTDFFVRMGYDVAEGPEIETNFYNFEALNTPAAHPARDDADTYYIEDPSNDLLLRTQTSGTQIRYMQTHQPPFRMVAPGRVFRRDDDITHSPVFHQMEGLVVGEGITFSHLKGSLQAFAAHIFGEGTRIRLRPSYFPFTEPSAEVDVTCPFCESGCRTCKGTTWIEILGCGMVDPNVFEAVGYDPEKVTGFAWGIGIERVAMLKYSIPDIRYLYQNDRRFLDQFKVG